jgi:DNA-binding MltR family transcriptional regulator
MAKRKPGKDAEPGFSTGFLSGPSDFEVAIKAHAQLEQAVKATLQIVFRLSDQKISDELLSHGKLRYELQCLLLHSLGIIGTVTLADLRLLAKIRNVFGHAHLNYTFSSSNIFDLLKKVQIPKTIEKLNLEGVRPADDKSFVATPRLKYVYCTAKLPSLLLDEAYRRDELITANQSAYIPRWLT